MDWPACRFRNATPAVLALLASTWVGKALCRSILRVGLKPREAATSFAKTCTLSLKTVRCEVVFTHLVCPIPCVVADMKRQVGILQVCQPLCTQFPTFFRLCRIRELKKAFAAPIFVMTLSLLIETAESFALQHSYLRTYASRHHMCSRRSLAPAATVPTTSHGTPSLISFAKE